MGKRLVRAVLDTNVIISALLFGGNPRNILNAVREREIVGITSPVLIGELADVLHKKFSFPSGELALLEKKMQRQFVVVYPKRNIAALQDDPDNRVLEAAVEGGADYIVTGDRELLRLRKYKSIRIVSPGGFPLTPRS